MTLLGNILWLICGGFLASVLWFIIGIVWSLTIVGLPIGLQCFKFAKLSLSPFGKEVYYGGGSGSFIINILWIVFSGGFLALEHLSAAFVLACSIIGLPFAFQHLKLAKLALMPVGSEVY